MTEEIFNTIFKVVLIPLLSVLTTYLVRWIDSKIVEIKTNTNNALLQKYLDMLNDIIISNVIMVNQTYVDSLKASGNFSLEAQQEAFKKVHDNIMASLGEEAFEFLYAAMGDLELYISTQIEAAVKLNKQ